MDNSQTQENPGGEIYIKCEKCGYEDSFYDESLKSWNDKINKNVDLGNPCNNDQCNSHYAIVQKIEIEK